MIFLFKAFISINVFLRTSFVYSYKFFGFCLLNFYLFIYLWLCWVFVFSVRGLSLVVASRGHSSSRCAGLSLSQPRLLWSTGSRLAGSVIVAHGPSCSAACGIFPDQGSNPCPLHWQADSQPLRHQGSPLISFDTLCFPFSFVSRYYFAFSLISSLTYWLFRTVLFNFHIFVNFPVFLLFF